MSLALNLFQSREWGEFQKSLPGRGAYWLVEAEGARALVVRQRLPFGLCWLSIARGPLFEDGADVERVWTALWEKIRELAARERAVFVRVELPAESPLGLEKIKGWRAAHAHYQPEWTLRVNLSLSEADILAQMKPKGRYNIKVAKKNGVTIREGGVGGHTLAEDVAAFYEILKKTGGRDGFAVHERAYYERLIERGHAEGWAELFVAELEGKMIGGTLVTFYGDTATYYYGASDHASRAMMAPYLLQWTAMREAKKRSFRWYDFLGVAPLKTERSHPWAGITAFKEKFGGERVHYPVAREFVVKKGWHWGIRLYKSLRKGYFSRSF